jgi:hypothetical protein
LAFVLVQVFQGGKVVFFVASRGHHAEIGGITPGRCLLYSAQLLHYPLFMVDCLPTACDYLSVSFGCIVVKLVLETDFLFWKKSVSVRHDFDQKEDESACTKEK